MDISKWGRVTPEATLDGKDEYIYIYNHDLSTLDKVNRNNRCIIVRITYYDYHLPPHPKHFIQIDIRGQQVSDETCNLIITNLTSKYQGPGFLKVIFINE